MNQPTKESFSTNFSVFAAIPEQKKSFKTNKFPKTPFGLGPKILPTPAFRRVHGLLFGSGGLCNQCLQICGKVRIRASIASVVGNRLGEPKS